MANTSKWQRGDLGSVLASWFCGDIFQIFACCKKRGTCMDLAVFPAEAAVGTTEVMSGKTLSVLGNETLHL